MAKSKIEIDLLQIIKAIFIYLQNSPGKEKISIGLSSDVHVTIHFGTKSKIFDIHLKHNETGKYHTLIQLRHFRIGRLLVNLKKELNNITTSFLHPKNYMRPGKMNRHRLILFPMDFKEHEYEPILSFRKNKRYVRFKPNLNINGMADYLLFPSEAFSSGYSVFMLLDQKGSFRGIVFQNVFNIKSVKYHFLNKKSLNELLRKINNFTLQNLEETDLKYDPKKIQDFLKGNLLNRDSFNFLK